MLTNFHEGYKRTTVQLVEKNVIKAEVKMKRPRQFLCVVTLGKKWKLKTKFRTTLSNCGLLEQRAELAPEMELLKNFLTTFESKFKKQPVSQLPIGTLIAELKARLTGKHPAAKKFYDLDFLPSDLSVYNHVIQDAPLDIAVHWRRPEEFLYVVGDLNKISYRSDDKESRHSEVPKRSLQSIQPDAKFNKKIPQPS